jgi:hypothetical protein
MTAKERDRDIKHWEKVIEKYEKQICLNSDDRQQIAYAEFRINQIREEWRQLKLSTLS